MYRAIGILFSQTCIVRHIVKSTVFYKINAQLIDGKQPALTVPIQDLDLNVCLLL